MFLCFRSIVHCFQCFVRGPSPFGKKFPINLPYPSEIPMIFHGGGMDIFWNHTLLKVKYKNKKKVYKI